MTGFIAATIPAKVLRVSDTTLFNVAMQRTGDPLQWVAIAQLNGLVDPWIFGQKTVLIPPVLPTGAQSGIHDGGISPSYGTTDSVVSPLANNVTVPIAPPGPPAPPSMESDPVPVIF